MYKDLEKQKAAWRRYYQKNPEAFYSRRTVKRNKIRDFIITAKSKPCDDCEVEYPPHVMQFDHVRGEKAFNIAGASHSGFSLRKIQAEIDKCEVVCANCHAERTHQRLLEA